MEHTEREDQGPQPRGRGGLASAIRGTLSRTGPDGPAHWGGQPPTQHHVQAPVDVVGTAPVRRLPPTG